MPLFSLLESHGVDPLPPVLNVCFQQLMEGATSKFLILQVLTRKYLISKPVTSSGRPSEKQKGRSSCELCPYF